MCVKMDSLYSILEIVSYATTEQIKKAYIKKALLWHPDRVKAELKDEAEEIMKEINLAYAVLKDPKKRKKYDKYGVTGDEEIIEEKGFLENLINEIVDIGKYVVEDFKENTVKQNKEAIIEEEIEEEVIDEKYHINIKESILCSKCSGRGKVNVEEGFFIVTKKCKKCDGEGYVPRPVETNPWKNYGGNNNPPCNPFWGNIVP